MISPEHLSPEIVNLISAIPLAIGTLVFLVGAIQSFFYPEAIASHFAGAVTLGLEFFLAVGLLRLAIAQNLTALLMVVSIIAIRTVIKYGIKASVRAETE